MSSPDESTQRRFPSRRWGVRLGLIVCGALVVVHVGLLAFGCNAATSYHWGRGEVRLIADHVLVFRFPEAHDTPGYHRTPYRVFSPTLLLFSPPPRVGTILVMYPLWIGLALSAGLYGFLVRRSQALRRRGDSAS